MNCARTTTTITDTLTVITASWFFFPLDDLSIVCYVQQTEIRFLLEPRIFRRFSFLFISNCILTTLCAFHTNLCILYAAAAVAVALEIRMAIFSIVWFSNFLFLMLVCSVFLCDPICCLSLSHFIMHSSICLSCVYFFAQTPASF